MRKLVIEILILFFLFSSVVLAAPFHIFLIDQKESAVINEVSYDFWRVGPYYLMEEGDPVPEGYTVHWVYKEASAGGYDMLYLVVQKGEVFTEAQTYPEFAGGGSSYGNAWSDLIIRSFSQMNAHSQFAIGAVARFMCRAYWYVGEEPTSGSVLDWQSAGSPEPVYFGVGRRILGAD